jgi:hypothetical protein
MSKKTFHLLNLSFALILCAFMIQNTLMSQIIHNNYEASSLTIGIICTMYVLGTIGVLLELIRKNMLHLIGPFILIITLSAIKLVNDYEYIKLNKQYPKTTDNLLATLYILLCSVYGFISRGWIGGYYGIIIASVFLYLLPYQQSRLLVDLPSYAILPLLIYELNRSIASKE